MTDLLFQNFPDIKLNVALLTYLGTVLGTSRLPTVGPARAIAHKCSDELVDAYPPDFLLSESPKTITM